MDVKQLYEEKRPDYFSSVRHEILPLVPAFSRSVLDIGCGEGATLKWLRDTARCKETCGVEFMDRAAETARRVLDRVEIGNIESETFDFKGGQFNLILCLDVLEHLRDPWDVIKRVSGWLAPNGVLVVSVPNIRYRSVLSDLALKGQFDYQQFGILDRTHLRFFTRKSAIELLQSAGLHDIELVLHPSVIHGKAAVFNLLSFGYFRDVFSWQLLLRGVKVQLAGNDL